MDIREAMLQTQLDDARAAHHQLRSQFGNLLERLNILLDEEDWDRVSDEIRAYRQDAQPLSGPSQ